jgi:arylamine N-acetyltransferase
VKPAVVDWVGRYLHMLGLPDLKGAEPSLDALGQLCRSQVSRVPFENVSSILRRQSAGDGPVPALDFDSIVSAWEARAGGGVCVDASPTFRRLLMSLGYAARPTLAQISFPGSHQASIVELDGREYLVDVANGAPFFEPIPVDDETVLRRAGLAWRFHRERPDMLVQDRLIDGTWTPFCHYTLPAAKDVDIEAAYQRHHVPGESFVVTNLTVVRCTDSEVLRLRDDELARYSDSGATLEHIELDALPALVAEVFHAPALPVLEAAAALRALRPARVSI